MGNCQGIDRKLKVDSKFEKIYEDCQGYVIINQWKESDYGCMDCPFYHYEDKVIIFKSQEMIDLMKTFDIILFRNIEKNKIRIVFMKRCVNKLKEWYEDTMKKLTKDNEINNIDDLKLDSTQLKLMIQVSHLIKDLDDIFHPEVIEQKKLKS